MNLTALRNDLAPIARLVFHALPIIPIATGHWEFVPMMGLIVALGYVKALKFREAWERHSRAAASSPQKMLTALELTLNDETYKLAKRWSALTFLAPLPAETMESATQNGQSPS